MGLPAQNNSPPPVLKPRNVFFKKGELLFREGDNSRTMYLIKNGIVRVFKNKEEGQVEMETFRGGQIVGELSFLDGNPRSAAAEALTAVEAVEISSDVYTAIVDKLPEWFSVLMKGIVGRLRTAGTRIRQMESKTTAVTYNKKDGTRSVSYAFLSINEVLRICSALLLVASRNGEKEDGKIYIKVGLLQRYANQVMNVPVAKITTFLDLLSANQIMSIPEGSSELFLLDPDFIEQFIAYVNEENLLEPEKRHDITLKGFIIMTMIQKHLDKFPADPVTGRTTVNIGQIKNIEESALGKEVFRLEEFDELVKIGYATTLAIKSAEEVLTTVNAKEFKVRFRLQRLLKAIESTNDRKNNLDAKKT